MAGTLAQLHPGLTHHPFGPVRFAQKNLFEHFEVITLAQAHHKVPAIGRHLFEQAKVLTVIAISDRGHRGFGPLVVLLPRLALAAGL